MGTKKKIAVLGSGLGAMTTAFELTNPDNPRRNDYEVTVYQIGWRLGGKGASGRNMDPAYSCRIEEHGLHIFFGFYENAFRVMQQAYAEMDRPPDAPLATWQDAWKPHSYIVLEQEVLGKWTDWPFDMPTNSDVPGQGGLRPSLLAYVEEALQLIFDLFKSSAHGRAADDHYRGQVHEALRGLLGNLADEEHAGLNLKSKMLHIAHKLGGLAHRDTSRLAELLRQERDNLEAWLEDDRIDERIATKPTELGLEVLARIARTMLDLHWDHIKETVQEDLTVLRVWILLNWTLGQVMGAIADRLYQNGLDSINDQEYRAWLAKYVVDDGGLTVDSPPATLLYAALFAYERGEQQCMNLEAGTALRTLIRMMLTYKGAVMWKMQAGMGDTVFTPFYEVLKQRGVKFEFFHRVEKLKPSADGRSIQSIEIQCQIDVGPDGYDPLIDVEGLPCWPSRPLWSRIPDGERLGHGLEQRGVNLEAYYPPEQWPGAGKVTLEAGEDFDEVVLGISLAALPCVCEELIELEPSWQKMLAEVTTVRTQAFQLWLKPTRAELGWSQQSPVLTTYNVNPMNTWADMSYLIVREDWPAGEGRHPEDIAYFCGAMPEQPGDPPCAPKPGLDLVKQTSLELLRQHMGHLWPLATNPQNAPGAPLDWSLLVDNRPRPGQGEERFDSQYWVSIVNPSDRYVQTPAGSSVSRLRAGDSGFDNLFLTGDWIDNTFNIGAVEPTVMAGMSTANAMCGYPRLADIVGWNFGEPADD